MERALVTLALLALALVVGAPLATMVTQSLRVDQVVTREGRVLRGHVLDSGASGVTIRVQGETTSRLVPRERVAREERVFALTHYRHVLRGPGERNMLLATVALAGTSTLLAFFLGLPLGLLFAATDLPGRRVLETLSVLPLVLPPILLAIATYHDLLAVQPEFFRAVLVFGFSLFPLVSLFTARAVRATGAECLAAARIQTTPRDALLRVALGPALPGAAAGALLVFVFTVADFAVPDFLGVTTAKNTIVVYANAVFSYWNNDGDAGAATAAGMPPTVLALLAFGGLLWIESARGSRAARDELRELEPVPLGAARGPLLLGVAALLGLAIALPAWRHLETAGGEHFGQPVATGGARGTATAESDAKPDSVFDGLRRGIRADRVGESAWASLVLAGGGALLALLLALLLTEAGRLAPRLDPLFLVGAFLPVAVPPMSFAVGWVRFVGGDLAAAPYAPVLLMGARLLPFAAFAVRAARRRVGSEVVDAAALAGLPAGRRYLRVVLPLLAPGAALGLLLAFLFGLREVDALVFTRTGAETLPVQLYNMIHYGHDVEVAALSFLWSAAVALFLLLVALAAGSRFRLLP